MLGTAALAVATPAIAAEAKVALAPVTYTVGSDPGSCDFSNIHDAIMAAASGDTVQVSNEIAWPTAGLSIANKSLNLIGGFSDCNDTTTDSNAPTIIMQTGSESVITVSNAIAGVPTVFLRHLVLRQGDGGASKGGGIDVSGGLVLRVHHVAIEDNQAMLGGGIRIHGGPPSPTVRLEGGSLIGGTSVVDGGNNATSKGGGIYCDSGAQIEWRDASINYNSALDGGGLYLSNCALGMPSAIGTSLRTVDIAHNRALSSGAGLMAVDGATVDLVSEANRQVRIIANEADYDHSGSGDGGGLFIFQSSLTAVGLNLEENIAYSGAAFAVAGGGSIDMDRGNPNGDNCPSKPRCSTVSRNQSTGNLAGAMYAYNGNVDLRQTFVEDNHSLDNTVGVFNMGSMLTARSVQISGNTPQFPGTNSLIEVSNNSTMDLRLVTAAFNNAGSFFSTGNGSTVVLADSIFWQPGIDTLVDDGTTILSVSCLNAAENVTVPAATHNPGFRVGDGGKQVEPLLDLNSSSPNIDACSDMPLPNPAFDVVGQFRVVDVPEVADLGGALDRGAFEYQPPLFADGFED